MQPFAAHQRILRGVTATLSWQNVDGDGTAAAPSGTVTVGITKADGSTLVAAGAATSGTGSSPRTYSLTAANNTTLELLTATWTDAGDSSTHTTLIEVVGGYYFSVDEARASDQSLTNTGKYTGADIIAARREVEETFEDITNVSFVPRFERAVVSGQGQPLLQLRPLVRAIRSVRTYSDATNYTAWTADELATLQLTPLGVESRTGLIFTPGASNLVVEYEHGHDRPPERIRKLAMQYLRMVLNETKSAIPNRATSFSVTEGGTYSLDTAGARSTGDPDIDAALERHAIRDLIHG